MLALTDCSYLEYQEQFPPLQVSVVCPSAVRTRIFEDAFVAPATENGAWRDTVQGFLDHSEITPQDAAEAILDGLGTGSWIHTQPDHFTFFAARRAEMLSAQTPPPPPLM